MFFLSSGTTLGLLITIFFLRLVIEMAKEQRRRTNRSKDVASVYSLAHRRRVWRLVQKAHYRKYLYANDADKRIGTVICKVYQDLPAAVQQDEAFFRAFMGKVIESGYLWDNFEMCYPDTTLRNYLIALHYWYHKRGRRSIAEWQPPKERGALAQLLDLVGFLFETYPVPAAVANGWLRYAKLIHDGNAAGYTEEKLHPDNTWLRFYFHLAEGGSLRNTSLFPLPMSRKLAGFYPKAPAHLNAITAYWWAVSMAAGGSSDWSAMVAQLPFDSKEAAFWQAFLRFLVDNGKNLNFDDLGDLQQLIRLVKFGTSELADLEHLKQYAKSMPDLELKNWSAARLLKFLREKVALAFPPVPGLTEAWDFVDEEDGTLYRILRLRTKEELRREGEALNHCVGDGGYDYRCLAKEISIWSIRLIETADRFKRLATVELTEGVVTEYAGMDDAEPGPLADKVLKAWGEEFRLSV